MPWHQTTQIKQEPQGNFQLCPATEQLRATVHTTCCFMSPSSWVALFPKCFWKKKWIQPEITIWVSKRNDSKRGFWDSLFLFSVVLGICREAWTQPHSPLWRIRPILYSGLSDECFVLFFPFSFKTNDSRETQSKIFCKATFLTILVNELQIVLWFVILYPTVPIHYKII